VSAAAPACIIRTCASGDEAALSLIGQATFLEAFAGTLRGVDILEHCRHKHSPDLYRSWLADARVDSWIAEVREGCAVVGYLVMMAAASAELPLPDLNEHDAEIRRIYLLHRFQGQGLGRGLMRAARERALQRGARRLVLGVYSGNHAAIGFYESEGFRLAGRRTFRVGQTDCEDLILAQPL
jgi:ribosomal protein S18 acetylase RimI-like enzyme